MKVYIWIAAMGVIGLSALLLFIYTLSRDLKIKKQLKFSLVKLWPNGLLLILSICSFSLMVFFFLSVKEQLIQFGS